MIFPVKFPDLKDITKVVGIQCLSQDLETGCLKLAVVKFLGVQFFIGGSQYTYISTINICKFIKIRNDVIKQCCGNCKEIKKIQL